MESSFSRDELTSFRHQQKELAKQVIRFNQLSNPVQLIGGADIAYEEGGDRYFAAVVVLDVETMITVDIGRHSGTCRFPYVPGLFAFRELPGLVEAFKALCQRPNLVLCDGQGIAHPRRFGIASHFGLSVNVPTIGCGKSRLLGDYTEPHDCRGAYSDLKDSGEVIGRVLRTQPGVKPLFVSIGHCIDLDTACSWVLQLASHFRQPEPVRRANETVNTMRAQHALDLQRGKEAGGT